MSRFAPGQHAAPSEPLRKPTLPLVSEQREDVRLFALMRFILAFAGLAIIYVDPTQPSANEELTYGVFALYSLYAAALLVLAWKSSYELDQRLLCAFDVMFATFLVLWTHGTNSIFFYVFLFPVLVVSFSHGYRDGLIFTIASVLAFLISGSLADPPIVKYELSLALIRPVYLLALGYMIARWGGRELLLKKRLTLLRDVNTSGARATLDDVLSGNVRRLLDFHNAERCVFVLHSSGQTPRYVLYGASTGDTRPAMQREVPEESGERLLGFHDDVSVLYTTRGLGESSARRSCVTLNRYDAREATGEEAECAFVAELLEARHFVAVPYSQSDGSRGRIFLSSNRQRYATDDAQFLLQFSAALARVVENLQLVEELVSTAAEHERTMISRDIHDAAVQPYIGLRLGLEALHRQGGADSPLAPKILDLIDMANATVRDLRGYTRGLVAGREVPGGSLGAAIQMQAERHRRFYGLQIETTLDDESSDLRGRFASQLFYIVVEALANVVKHTSARRAFVSVSSTRINVCVRIGNERANLAQDAAGFVPKSIKSRVESLSGVLDVRHDVDGYTVVQATLPM